MGMTDLATEPDIADEALLKPLGIGHRYRVCICGSRTWGEPFTKAGLPRLATHIAVERATVGLMVGRLAELKGVALVLIVGGAKGADTMAEEAAKTMGIPFERFDADWRPVEQGGEGKSAGPMRNARMLASGLDLVVALYAYGEPFNPGMSRGGTNDMVWRSVAAGVQVHAWAEGRWRSFDGRRWHP
jgi:hypothetical protein